MSRSSWSFQLRLASLVILSAVLITAAASAANEQPESAASAADKQTGAAASVADKQAGAAASVADKQAGAAASAGSLYEVKDGNKVDESTLNGWKTWRALACERCHGAAQEGMVGPSLIESMKRLSKAEFHDRLMNGSPAKGMPPFSGSDMVNKNWEGLYAYLKGRSDGAIQPGRLTAIEQN
jgi:mono/diheme cytochrome c family protein